MLIGVAIWMLDACCPTASRSFLWALLVFLTGVFLGAFEPLPANPTPVRRLAKGIGVLACLYGALLLIGATLGGEEPLRADPARRRRRGSGGRRSLASRRRRSLVSARSRPSPSSMPRCARRGPRANP